MMTVFFRFYAELNDFLPEEKRFKAFAQEFKETVSSRDALEALGVPCSQVDLILVNGGPVDGSGPLKNGDRVSVYPMFESLDIGSLASLRPRPLREPRFVLDAHLGKLARYLRLAGFDALYRSDFDDAELAEVSNREGRILLTRDRALLEERRLERGYWVREIQPRRQLIEVLRRFDLAGAMRPFTRCLQCNRLLEPVEKESIAARLDEETRRRFEEFYLCPGCRRIYWNGSHAARMDRFLKEVVAEIIKTPGAFMV